MAYTRAWMALAFMVVLLFPQPSYAHHDDDDTPGKPKNPMPTSEAPIPPGLGYWPGADTLQIGFRFESLSFPIKLSAVSGSAAPLTTSEANRATSYDLDHVSGRITFAAGIDDWLHTTIGLGWVTTDMTAESENPTGVLGSNTSTTIESPEGFLFSVGIDLHHWFTELWWGTIGFESTLITATFNNQTLWDNVDGDLLAFMTQVHLKSGITVDMASLWLGVAVTNYTGDLDLKEQNAAPADEWDATLNQDQPVKGIFGLSLHPEDHLVVTLEFGFTPTLSAAMEIGWQF